MIVPDANSATNMSSTAALTRLSSLFTSHHQSRLVANRVGEAQQDRRDDPVGRERGSTGGEEGCRESRQRDDASHAAHDDEDLERDDEGEADPEQATEVILAGEADAEAARDEEQVEREDREEA